MEIIAKFQVERQDGKTESKVNVEAALLEELTGNIDSIDVEDSIYEVIDTEIVESPKAAGGGVNQAQLAEMLLTLADVYFKARPAVIRLHPDDPQDEVRLNMNEEERELDNTIFGLLNSTGELQQKAKLARYKAGKGK